MTPPSHDGPTAITHNTWVQTLTSIHNHPSSDQSVKQLAEMCLALIEINKHDPETVAYLNARASRALEK